MSERLGDRPVLHALHRFEDVSVRLPVDREQHRRPAVPRPGVARVLDRVDHIGDVFNDLLQHMADAPPLPVQQHRQEFLDYVLRNDLRCLGPFYSAYPERTVLDILNAGN